MPEAARAGAASEPLRRFIEVARGAGLRISAAESIDAMRVADVVGFGDRQVLHDSLSLVMAKSAEEKRMFTDCFSLYFRRDDFAGADDGPCTPDGDAMPSSGGQGGGGGGGGGQGEGGGGGDGSLAEMLLDNDRAGLAQAMEAAGAASGLANIAFFTQTNLYTRRIMERMGLRALEAEISAIRARNEAPEQERADRLEAGREFLRDQVRDFVERHLALFARGTTEKFREDMLRNARLSNLEKRDYERMRALVRAMAKRLAARYARNRRKRNRGQLDVRRTIRRNMAWEGIPFVTVWRQRTIEKPRVMVLCDVSGSVAAMAQFLLMFLYALNEALSDIRSFAFSGSLIEVSDILERDTTEAAIAKIMAAVGLGSSNYGNALLDFEQGWMSKVDSKTTVIILGDGRGNRTDPRTDIVERLSARSKKLIWLNPEYRSSWGTGDSDMLRYLPYCHVATVCNTLRHLETVVTDLLKDSR
ncbi:MAG: VWA domain-containing protein [Proteobacteria bacterium]|nr:VWA domain-containing protein [Pseudomonadota bacterium]